MKRVKSHSGELAQVVYEEKYVVFNIAVKIRPMWKYPIRGQSVLHEEIKILRMDLSCERQMIGSR